MAFTYLILNCVFMGIILFMLQLKVRRPSPHWWLALVGLLILTLVFDNLIIWAGIVEYDPTKITGVKLGYAPIEDFLYAVFAAVVVPLLWHRFGLGEKGNQ